MKKNFLCTSAIALLSLLPVTLAYAQTSKGGISPKMLQEMSSSLQQTPSEKALQNIVLTNGMSFTNATRALPMNGNFSNKVSSKGITDQKQSGRCWLFTGLNVLRSEVINHYNLDEFYFSQNYNFFWDQLEKSNLFLQAIIDTRQLPISDRKVEWLFRNPIGDGGQFTGVSDNIMKYGLVPSDIQPETHSSNNTSQMSSLIAKVLRQSAIRMREKAEKGASVKQLETQKMEALKAVYRLLVMNLGKPVEKFHYTLKDAKGNVVLDGDFTPQTFFQALFGKDRDLREEYVMIMNNPTLPYDKVYTIEYDRHMYDGKNWTYLNLPMEELKEMATRSIKDSTMLYYSCDVGKQLDRKTGLLTMDNFDYSSIAGISLDMDKRERIATGASGSTHAMTLMAVDIDQNGKWTKWMVENSWGPTAGYKGHLIMSDEWFDAYTFRIVVNKKYLTDRAKALLSKKAELLPPWDPMFKSDI